jgi:hypothetical protein
MFIQDNTKLNKILQDNTKLKLCKLHDYKRLMNLFPK